jgi:hypothetical protein
MRDLGTTHWFRFPFSGDRVSLLYAKAERTQDSLYVMNYIRYDAILAGLRLCQSRAGR